MKKYTLFLVVFSFIFSLFSINVNVASAITDPSEVKYSSYECKPGDKFNRKTGERCIEIVPKKECAPGDLFNSYTGKPCEVSIPNSVVISGVKGPQTLDVNQEGTWTVTAYSKDNNDLYYYVTWGDEEMGSHVSAASATILPPSQQSATFTHSYAQAGKYKPTFTVESPNTIRCIQAPCPGNGGSAQTSLSVNVGGPLIATEGSLYIEPSDVSLNVGGEARVKAYYQPSMLPCREGMACAQMMPAPVEVTATWSISNNKVAELRHIDCAMLGGCGGTTSVKGIFAGYTELKAKYTPSGGTTLMAIVKVFVGPYAHDKDFYKYNQTLRQNSRGEKVLELQEYLTKKGYDVGKMDGIFGQRVRAAVLKLQADKKLKVDGIVGPEVWTAIGQ